MMSSQYPRVQTRYPPQFDKRELVSFSPSHLDDHGTHNDDGNHYKLQQCQDGYKCAAEFPTSAYSISQVESTSWNSPTSSDLQSIITLSDFGFADNCSGFQGNGHDSLYFSSRTDFIPPPANLSLVSKDVPRDLYVACNSTVLPTVLDDSFVVSKLPECGTTNQVMPLGSASFDPLDDIAMWNESLLSPADESFVVAHAGQYHLPLLTLCTLLTSLGPWNMPADDGNAHVMDVDFVENVDGDALNILRGYMPEQQPAFQNPARPPEMTTGYDFSNPSWSHTGATSTSAAPAFQFEPSWNLRNQGHREESPSYSFPSSPPLRNTSQQPQESMLATMNHTLDEVRSDSLARFPEPRTTGDLPTLKPKPTLSSLGFITGRDSNMAISPSPKKPGRRNGPLDAEGRKGASQMRRDRACIACKLRKTRVS